MTKKYAMKDKIKEICNKLNREQISVQGATEQLFDLYNVVGQSEQLKKNKPFFSVGD